MHALNRHKTKWNDDDKTSKGHNLTRKQKECTR